MNKIKYFNNDSTSFAFFNIDGCDYIVICNNDSNNQYFEVTKSEIVNGIKEDTTELFTNSLLNNSNTIEDFVSKFLMKGYMTSKLNIESFLYYDGYTIIDEIYKDNIKHINYGGKCKVYTFNDDMSKIYVLINGIFFCFIFDSDNFCYYNKDLGYITLYSDMEDMLYDLKSLYCLNNDNIFTDIKKLINERISMDNYISKMENIINLLK